MIGVFYEMKDLVPAGLKILLIKQIVDKVLDQAITQDLICNENFCFRINTSLAPYRDENIVFSSDHLTQKDL